MRKLLDAQDELGGDPGAEELDRLVDNYRSYKLNRRKTLPQYFTGRTIKELVEDKLAALGLVSDTLGARSLGGHRRWAREKVNRAILRLLYLRYRIDEKLSRKHANQRVIQRYKSELGKSAIQKATRYAEVDK